MKICLAASIGGHLTQIRELKEVYEEYEHFFVTFRGEESEIVKDLSKYEKVYLVTNPHRSFINFLICLFQSFKIIKKEKPSVIITTGSGVALPICIHAKLFRKKIIFIESFSRITTPSGFGKLVYPIADLTIVQWKPLLEYYKKAIYGGPIFDFSCSNKIKDNEIKNQIFVIAGARYESFDRPIKEIDRVVGEGLIKEKVIAQIGNTKYEPKNYEWFRFTSVEKFEKLIKESEIIITHGGVGSIINSLRMMKCVIAIPRLFKFGECTDNHQLDITRELEKQGKIIAVYDIKDMEKALKRAKELKLVVDKKESGVAKIIGDYFREI